jgi:hypothetical protein
MDSASLFAGILIGQPTLSIQLRMGVFAALDQRIATRFTIKAMDIGESAAYLRHHMTLVGREEPLFADDAVARLHRVSNGLPRALNNAATAALIAAAADSKDLITTPVPRRQQPSSHGTEPTWTTITNGPPRSPSLSTRMIPKRTCSTRGVAIQTEKIVESYATSASPPM